MILDILNSHIVIHLGDNIVCKLTDARQLSWWHIKGVCFTGCNLSTTHREILDINLQREMDLY